MPKIPFKDGVALLSDPDGRPIPVQESEVQIALTSGYSPATPEQVDEYLKQQKYGEGVGNILKSTAIGAAEGIVPFGGKAVAQGLLGKEAAEEIPKRNPVSNVVGNVLGAGAGIALAPEAKALQGLDLLNQASGITKIGSATERLVSRALPEATTLVGRTVKAAAEVGAGSAVAGAVYSGAQSATEAMLGDPDLTAQKALSNMGYTALISGGFGAALGIPKGLLSKVASKEAAILGETAAEVAPKQAVQSVDDVLDAIKNDVNAEIYNLTPEEAIKRASSIENSLDSMNLRSDKKANVLEGLQKLKKNSKEITDAASEIGAPVLESQVSASKHVQDVDSMLLQSPTPVGVARREVLQNGLDAANRAIDDSLAVTNKITEAETGNLIKTGIATRLEAELKPISDLYETIKRDFKEIPVDKKAVQGISDGILKIEGIGLSPSSPEFRLAKSVAAEIKNIATVEDLKQYQTILSRRSIGAPELKYVAGKIKERLVDLEEQSIISFAKEMPVVDSEARSAVDALIKDRKSANAKYAAFRDKLSELGSVIGKKKIYGPTDFIDFLEELPPEKLATRLFDKKNSEFLKFFAEEFPDEMKALGNLFKNKLKDNALRDGVIQPGKVMREIKKLSPEVQSLLFDGASLKKLNAAKVYIESIPANINPSGTSKSEAYRRFFSSPVSSTLETAKDYATLKGMQIVVGKIGGPEAAKVEQLINLEISAQSVTKKITSLSKDIIKGVPAGIAGAVGNNKEENRKVFQKRSRQISDMMADPIMAMNKVQGLTEQTFATAPNVSGAVQMSAIRATQFLYSKLPSQTPTSPLGPVPVVPDSEVSKFNNIYDVVDNPLLALHQISNGTLRKYTVEAVATVYPELYGEMQAAIYRQLTSSKTKPTHQTKLMLSMFTGQPLIGSLFPQSLVKNQLASNNRKSNQQPVKPTVGGMKDLDISGRSLTGLQKVSSRE